MSKKKNLIAAGLATGMIFGVSAMAQAAPVQWTANGHYYDAISFPQGITWDDAKIVAENSTYLGMNGHLATITSPEENSFILHNLGGPITLNMFFLGGFQPPGSLETTGNWQWITGEPWSFSNWWPSEPNNTYGGDGFVPQPEKRGWDEEGLQFYGSNGTWNDIEQSSYWGGLIVEYTAPIPEPESYAMLLLGLGLIGVMARRRK